MHHFGEYEAVTMKHHFIIVFADGRDTTASTPSVGKSSKTVGKTRPGDNRKVDSLVHVRDDKIAIKPPRGGFFVWGARGGRKKLASDGRKN